MSTDETLEDAVETLQQLGLKEYESRCFVGLSRLSTATAKELSEVTDVPRTRVYDAIRVLEAEGLVEVQHSSPQKFRAVPLDEALSTFRASYETRVDRLRATLEGIDTLESRDDASAQEVWAIADERAIANRTAELIADAEEEVVLVVGDDSLVTDELLGQLRAVDDGVTLLVGTYSSTISDHVESEVPQATTFVSGLEWLDPGDPAEQVAVGRLLLVDRSAILLSSIVGDTKREQAVFGTGFGNGLVVIARRLMAQGLDGIRDPSD